jgi:hypothetical protein
MTAREQNQSDTVVGQLLRFEATNDLWHARLLGYPFWPGQRLGHALRMSTLQTRSGETKALRSKRRLRRIKVSVSDLVSKIFSAKGRDIWVFSSTAYRRATGNGQTCIFAEHLREQLADRLLFLEINPNAFPAAHSTERLFIDSLLLGANELASKAVPLVKFGFGKTLNKLNELGLDQSRVLKESLSGRLQYQVWKQVLRKARPSAIFVICSYSQHIPMQIAARELGIPLIELQHGIIHAGHPGYAFGRELNMPHVPDHIVVFGQRFAQILEQSSDHWRGRWTIAGHPWLRRIRARYLAERIPRPRVTIFSQNTAVVQARLRAFALQLRKILPSDVELVIKPHPGEVDALQVYGELTASGISVLDRMADSYTLLAQTTVCICEFSTLALEALAFPCHSLVLDSPALYEDLREMANTGAIRIIQDARDVLPFLGGDTDVEQRQRLVDTYFAISQPEPDFAELILRCAARTNPS